MKEEQQRVAVKQDEILEEAMRQATITERLAMINEVAAHVADLRADEQACEMRETAEKRREEPDRESRKEAVKQS